MSAPATSAAPTTAAEAVATTAPPPTTEATTTTSTIPDPCADVGDEPCVRIESILVAPDNGAITVNWSAENFEPSVSDGFHAHLFWNDIQPIQAGTDAPDDPGIGDWDAVDNTTWVSGSLLTLANQPVGATAICGTVGQAPTHITFNHELFHCVDLPESGC